MRGVIKILAILSCSLTFSCGEKEFSGGGFGKSNSSGGGNASGGPAGGPSGDQTGIGEGNRSEIGGQVLGQDGHGVGEITPGSVLSNGGTVRPLIGCQHVVHGGSERAADGMNRSSNPAFATECEVLIDLKQLYTAEAVARATSLTASFQSSPHNSAPRGRTFPDNHRQTATGPTVQSLFPDDPSHRESCNQNLLPGQLQVCVQRPGPKSILATAQYDPVNKTVRLKVTRNGNGACRWKDHCYTIAGNPDINLQ